MWVNLGGIMGFNWGLGDFCAGFQVLVILVVGAFFVEAGNLTAGEFLAFTAYNSMLVWPVRNLGRLLSELSKTSISATRLFDILDAEEEADSPGAVTPPLTGDIVFSHVDFGYGAGEVLEDVSFTIKAGTTFGILGATGSGKSTLMALLDRLYQLPRGPGRHHHRRGGHPGHPALPPAKEHRASCCRSPSSSPRPSGRASPTAPPERTWRPCGATLSWR